MDNFEEQIKKDLITFLKAKGVIDQKMPECPDVEEKWPTILSSYLPDGIREFNDYPVVSLGWMMFVGMAIARYWDQSWEKYCTKDDLYEAMRDTRGYDNMDESILEDILGYEGLKGKQVSDLVAECASRVNSLIIHSRIEGGTQQAFEAYVAALHQLYLSGMAVELYSLGYRMTLI